MTEAEEYIKRNNILENELTMTRNDLAIANQRLRNLQKRNEELSAENRQLREGIIPNYRPSIEEMLAFVREFNLLPDKREESVPVTLPHDNKDVTANASDGYADSETERVEELKGMLEERDLQIAQLRDQLEEKDKQLAEIQSQKDAETQQHKAEKEKLEQDLANSKSNTKLRTQEHYGKRTESQAYQSFLGGPKEDRRIEEECFNGKHIEALNQEEKDSLAISYQEYLDKQSARLGKNPEDIEREIKEVLEKKGFKVDTIRSVRSKKAKAKLADIDYSKSTEEIKEQLKKALCPDNDPENVEVILVEGEIPGRVVTRNGKPDYNYYIVREMVQEAKYKTMIIQELRIEVKDEEVAPGCAPSDEPADVDEPANADEPINEEADEDLDEDKKKKRKYHFVSYTSDLASKRALNCCCFSTILLTWILIEKYHHGSTYEDIIARLRHGGMIIQKSTFNENVHRASRRLRLSAKDLFLRQIRLATHLQVDETFVIVAVKKEDKDEDGKTEEVIEFKIRYIWCFYDEKDHIVYYAYENGSRSADVLESTLFPKVGKDRVTIRLKTLLTDGFSAYNLFDKLDKNENPFIGEDGKPLVLHCADWVHARRYVCRCIFESRNEAFDLLSMIRELFVIEAVAKKSNCTPERIEFLRMNHSLPVMNEIFKKVEEYSKDPILMGRQHTKAAITYLLNQKIRLMNYIQDGECPISSNGVERKMKQIKKILRVSMFIGSEEAACNFAFMLSLRETAKELGLDFPRYMKDLLDGLQGFPRLKVGKEDKFKAIATPMAEPYMPWNYVKRS